ncbi:hypothetical protein J31TS4_27320 [Paenibacillus sp. J31TS4]|uniref:hypothetical protein n=1 Tax=Paenibacillus sp. J31TS4 TaxID=2807195 RepID=UPI001B0DCFD7|nr:hypothetical protein [Paenibacillus sp. J31TS4]GIP39452.1 hypothetical protein J31TS4_27320 [Paenibacillus sp. J31TS4]
MRQHPKGRVEFRQPAVKLVAELPDDEAMRERLEEAKETDGYEGSCLVDWNTERQD